MIIYTPFEISRRVLTLFVIFDIDQIDLTKKLKKHGKQKKVPLFRDFHEFRPFNGIPAEFYFKNAEKFRLNILEFRLLVIHLILEKINCLKYSKNKVR